MKKMTKVTIELEDKLLSSIKQYCSYNNLVLYKYINSLIKESFNIDRYGNVPGCFILNNEQEITNVEEPKQEEVKAKTTITKTNTITVTKTNTSTSTKEVLNKKSIESPVEEKKVVKKRKRTLN